MNSGKILVTGNFSISPEHMSERVIHIREPRNEQDIIDNLSGVQHYVIGGPEYANDHILSRAHDLKHVVVMGTQTSSFLDVDSALSRGISIENTPGMNANAVAEFALGMLVVHLADSFLSHQNLLDGGWQQRPHKTLSEVKLGIVGMGNIGTRLARKVRSISQAQLCYFSRTRKADIEQECGVEFMRLERLAKECDALVVCVTYKPETHKLINTEILKLAKDGLILLNFCHPTVVDPVALKDALDSGRVKFSYLDGYYSEWTNNEGVRSDKYGLLALGPGKFVATEHIAAQSDAVNAAILEQAFAKIARWDEHNGASPSRRAGSESVIDGQSVVTRPPTPK